jgi:hypothetical protein
VSFSPPGNVDDLTADAVDAWSEEVSVLLDQAIAAMEFGEGPPPFFNPVTEPLEAKAVPVIWPALSGNLEALTHLSDVERGARADGDRLRWQDEYCEWSVTRDDEERITSVTFTSEVKEWWEHVGRTDKDLLIGLYRTWVDPNVDPNLLFDAGVYNPQNPLNTRTDGPIAHLAQVNNNLEAAVALAATATIVRTLNGQVVTDTQKLMDCAAALGDKDRFSDPSIASTINAAAAVGDRVTLADPPGLYLAGIRTEGMALPDGHEEMNPADFWVPERGGPGHVVRARFEVPGGAFPVSDIVLDGEPITTGGQLAKRVDVSITALVHVADQPPVARPCGD